MPQPWTVAQFAALVPLTLGAAIYFRCLWEFAVRGRGIPAPLDHPKQLVVTGLYLYVRNPMYLGVLTVLAGCTKSALCGASLAIPMSAILVQCRGGFRAGASCWKRSLRARLVPRALS